MEAYAEPRIRQIAVKIYALVSCLVKQELRRYGNICK